MTVYFTSPWRDDKNIGIYCNDFMSKLGTNDFACIIDGDSVWTTFFYGKQINDIIKEYPECSLFSCMTNRVACSHQVVAGIDWFNNDMKYHREIGEYLFRTKYKKISDVSNFEINKAPSGVMMLIKKTLWNKIGGFYKEGCLDVDNKLFYAAQKAKEPIYIMQGCYLYHWYRNGIINNMAHLICGK